MALPKKIQQQISEGEAAVQAYLDAESAALVVDPTTGLPPGEPAAPEASPVPPAPQTSEFEQKYRTLQGKYDSEVPLLRSQLQNYERINGQLSGQVTALTEQVRILSARPVSTAPSTGNVTDADVTQYGSELIDLMRRVASEAAGAHMGHVQNVVAQEVSAVRADVANVQHTQATLTRKSYEDGLTNAVPDWQAINATPEWLNWLKEFDPILGTTRQAAVSQAYDAYDVPRTVAFLKQYLRLQSLVAPALTPAQELALQVTPRATHTGVTPVEAPARASKIWTQEEIGNAYRNQIQGRNRLAPEAWAALEAEISQAAAEGRVR